MAVTLGQILSNDPLARHFRVIITLPTGYGSVVGILRSFTINGVNSSYENFNLLSRVLSTFNSVLPDFISNYLGFDKIASQFGLGGATGGSNSLLPVFGIGPSVANSVKAWKGSSVPSLMIGMSLVQYLPNRPVVDEWSKLVYGVLPSKIGFNAGGVDATVLRAPYGYKPVDAITGSFSNQFSYNSALPNTTTVQVGEWFKMGGLLIKDAPPNFSQELNNEGNPVYMDTTLNLEPYKAISASEFLRSFTNISPNSIRSETAGGDIVNGTAIWNAVTAGVNNLLNRTIKKENAE